MPQMEYNDEVIKQIREGKAPMEMEQEQNTPPKEDKRVESAKPSKYEKQARKDGWVPVDAWIEQGKSEDDWVDAPEFVRRGELMNRIKSQSKALKAAEKQQAEFDARLKAVTEHNAKIAKIEYEKAVKALKKQKLEAIDERDHETVLEIDEQLDQLEEQAKAAEAQESKEEIQADPTMPPALADWLESDSSEWYRNDPILQAAADKLAEKYASQHFDRTGRIEDQAWDELLDDVEEQLRAKFPTAFPDYEEESVEEEEEVDNASRKPAGRRRVGQVSESSRAPAKTRQRGGKTKLSVNDLTPDERKAHDEFVLRQQVMTSEEYLGQLEAVRDL